MMNDDKDRNGPPEWSKEARDPLTDKVIGVFFSVFNELGYDVLSL